MPLYYFHVHDGMSYPDANGIELKSTAEAKTMALSFFGELTKLYTDRIVRGEQLIMDVADEQQRPVCKLQLTLSSVYS
jgi:hypothetical protein